MIYKNQASQVVFTQMNSRVDGSPLTSAVSVTVVVDNGADGAGAGTLTHVANGKWKYQLTQSETNGEVIGISFTHATGIDVTLCVSTVDLNTIADAILKRDMSAVSGEAARSPLNALRLLRNKWSFPGGTLTVCKEDDTTAAWTGTPTVDGAALPITGIDPS